MRDELGFDQYNPYKDEADEVEMQGKTDMDRNMIIADRVEEAKAAEFKYN